jgi:hypothetical protein
MDEVLHGGNERRADDDPIADEVPRRCRRIDADDAACFADGDGLERFYTR